MRCLARLKVKPVGVFLSSIVKFIGQKYLLLSGHDYVSCFCAGVCSSKFVAYTALLMSFCYFCNILLDLSGEDRHYLSTVCYRNVK